MSPNHRRFGARQRAAVAAARGGAWLSRRTGFGDGTAIGGRLALRLDRDIMTALSTRPRVALVSATNGKTTVSAMLAAALRTQGTVAVNSGGANMAEGVVMALSSAPRADWAVLEVDEVVLDPIARRTRPDVVVLMNLSREYTRGVSLQRTMSAWQDALGDPRATFTVVANADDPLVAFVARPLIEQHRVVWVAGGSFWRRDARLCPACLGQITWLPDSTWCCTSCPLARPEPDWTVQGRTLTRAGRSVSIDVDIPGRWLISNASFAVAAAEVLGVDPAISAARIAALEDVDGRYVPMDVAGREVRLFLVKNPASWDEAVTLADDGSPIVLALEPFGIKDMVPQWDAHVERLHAVKVVCTGERRHDIAVLLEVAGVGCTVVDDPRDAVLSLPPGRVHVIANYTAFKDLRKRFAP